MRKILHVGTHKTATTSFQACLRNNRDVLAQQNLIFPDLSEVGLPDGVGHHSLIGQLAEKPDRARDAVSRIYRNSEKTVADRGTVLISSERCYRHTISADKDEKPRQKRRNFVKLLSEVFGRDTEIAVVLRRPDNFAESSYQETIKKGNRTDNIQSFLKSPGFGMRLDYAFQLRLFRKAFDQVHVFIYEDLIEGVEGPEMELLRGLGLDVELAKRPERRNTSLHAFLIEYKRLINYQKLPPVQLKNLIEKLLELQKERRFEWTEERLSFLTLADRQSILEKHREGLNWIAGEFFEGRTTPLFSPPDQPKSVFSEMPVAVFEEIHREVCSGLNGRSLFF